MHQRPSARTRCFANTLAFACLLISAGCSENGALETSSTSTSVVVRSQGPQQLWQHTGSAQGTTFTIKYFAAEVLGSPLFSDVLEMVDVEANLWRADARIVAINEWPYTDSLYSFFDSTMVIGALWARSLELHRATGGAYDPTVGPLVELWGRNQENTATVTPSQVDSVLRIVGMRTDRFDMNEVTENRIYVRTDVRKRKSGAKLDFNAIAQGYTVDLLAEALRMEGVTNCMVELGGEVFCRGEGPGGRGWLIGVDRPELGSNAQNRNIQTVVSVRDRAICTSGSYRKFIEVNGQRYSHMINPLTGYPTHGSLLSATVMAQDAATADALGTAFMVMGVEKTQDFLLEHADWGLEVLLLSDDGDGDFASWETEGWSAAVRAGDSMD